MFRSGSARQQPTVEQPEQEPPVQQQQVTTEPQQQQAPQPVPTPTPQPADADASSSSASSSTTQPAPLPGSEGVHIDIIADMSGSMARQREETISALNEYVNGQRNETVDAASVTFSTFEGNRVREIFNGMEIGSFPLLTSEHYDPSKGGMTNLNDAVGQRLEGLDDMLRTKGTDETAVATRPAVIVVILTDGLENCSRYYSKEKIRRMIKEREEKGWVIIFLGADIDAWSAARSMGVDVSQGVVSYQKKQGMAYGLRLASEQTKEYRQDVAGSKATGTRWLGKHNRR
uniref:VWFA domain-containing protein n=1 Tax=Chromera velia CCMP2878 TaxID=1169474 RepID=A0A0G4GSE2_9ALVE|eukprot:Cvel_23124.t1-p1 / transcript=Cvel_23124.t1 / gene=Cvel_23124 / organism=Chromera_velia_CCMP2878 / gene_product=hypothetical protein / transcript_product=hypothetical protein / location=Cvel_scaffold2348:28657-29517(-) / protein_length=287 / sequence_SO=supercontig / SO=protein_coding / is_pseudo=false